MSLQTYTITNVDDDDADIWANDWAVDTTTTPTILAGHTDGLAHLITITPSASHTSTVYTITGTDADGHAGQTEALTVAGSALVPSVKYYRTVTALSIPAVIADAITVDVGVSDDAVGKTMFLNRHSATGALVTVDTNATTVTFAIQELAGADAFKEADPAQAGGWRTTIVSGLDTETADALGQLAPGLTACRVLELAASNSTTDLTVTVSQPADRG